jgi:hypothetical protein
MISLSASRFVSTDRPSETVEWRLQAKSLTEMPMRRLFPGSGTVSPNIPLLQNGAYFRIGGDPLATREDVQNDLRKCLDEWFGDNVHIENRRVRTCPRPRLFGGA